MASNTLLKSIPNTQYYYDSRLDAELTKLRAEVLALRKSGSLSTQVLKHLRNYFRIKNIYNSNAIEGNQLDIGETRLVVEQGITISGKPLKDSLEAKNLAHALDLFETLADREGEPIIAIDVRNLHAAILKGINDEEAGKYRTLRVEISGSEHKPTLPESVPPEMDKFIDWLKKISQPANLQPAQDPLVLACVAHTWFVYIHPFIDGNGRVSRLLLNLILMRFGYPVAIITREDRQRYYDSLKESDSADLTSFVSLVVECIKESLEEYQVAAVEQRQHQEWAASLVSALGEKELIKTKNEYEVWRSAMDLLKNYFRQTADTINQLPQSSGLVHFTFKEFGIIEFEKFLSLRGRESVKRTWFFGVQIRSGQRRVRYLFWFGFASFAMAQKLGNQDVTLWISLESGPSNYQSLESMPAANTPDLFEIGYLPKQEQFLCRSRGGRVEVQKADVFVKNFFEQIAKRQF